jgi:phenylalanyl-tRNA synthetase beta chain
MNASYEWLRAFVPFDLTPAELRDLITSRCATVDELVPLRADLDRIVVARVVEAKRHPNSDHLWVTKVDAGTGSLTDVVCGAPNVEQGRLYPFAPVGTTIPGGLTIEKRKIRGETSAGMLCSARELGLGQEHDGIMVLDVDVAPGTPFLDAMPVGDTRIVIDVLPNRPDLLAHAGVAREIAAATGLPLALPQIHKGEGRNGRRSDADARPPITVDVQTPGDAPRYTGVEMRGVEVGPSPEWLVRRLEAVGSRSINNVVDATNYVMHELGQPLHAFDADKLGGRRVVVRRARPGERLVTLDGVERSLDPEMTVIADAERAQAIAGVMGGAASEVGEGTTAIFIESATFDPKGTRATRRRLNLPTDASYRFERGVDPELPLFALERVVAVIQAVAGGHPVGDAVDVYPVPAPRRAVTLRVARVARVLGVEVPAEEIAALLQRVAFGVAPARESGVLRVEVPSWRGDVKLEVDLIEEVARLRGYDTLPDEIRPYRPGTVPDAPLSVTGRRLREALVAEGLFEVRPMPFVTGAADGFVRVANPLAENEAYLRTELLDSLARRAEYNLAHMQGSVRIFEIGTAFAPGGGGLPAEEMRAAALVMGPRRPPHFTEPRPPAYDEWDAKALGERIAQVAFLAAEVSLDPVGQGDLLWSVAVGGQRVGVVRRVALDAPVWAAPAFGVEIALARIEQSRGVPPAVPAGGVAAYGRGFVDLGGAPTTRGRTYRPLPTTPAVEFDVAVLVPDSVSAAAVEGTIRREAGELLERLTLFDEFRGPGVPPGTRSLAWRLTFRHPERTLREKEVEGRRTKLLRTLESELGVRPRS